MGGGGGGGGVKTRFLTKHFFFSLKPFSIALYDTENRF